MKKLLLLALTCSALSACKKDTINTPAAATTRTDLLVAKDWRVSAQSYTVTSTAFNGGAPLTTDIYASYYGVPCRGDNSMRFYTNNTLIGDEGALKCSPTDPQTKSGTWSFNSDQTKLTMVDPTQGGTPVAFDVIALSATTLQLRNTIVTNGGVVVTTVNDITFSPK